MKKYAPLCNSEAAGCDKLVKLNRLSYLDLCERSLVCCAHFTIYISFPPTCLVRISSRQYDPDDGLHEFPNIVRVLLSCAPINDRTHLIVDFTQCLDITLQTMDSPNPLVRSIQLKFQEGTEDDDIGKPRQIRHIINYFSSLQEIECLEILLHKNHSCSSERIDALARMSHISELRIRNTYPSHVLWLFRMLGLKSCHAAEQVLMSKQWR